jgi:hypothetical protein
VRVRIRSRSTSAKPPRTAIISRPVLVAVSAHGSAGDRNCPPASTAAPLTSDEVDTAGLEGKWIDPSDMDAGNLQAIFPASDQVLPRVKDFLATVR